MGIYRTTPAEEVDEKKRESYVGMHLKKQLAFDLWYIVVGLLIITIAEGPRLANSDPVSVPSAHNYILGPYLMDSKLFRPSKPLRLYSKLSLHSRFPYFFIFLYPQVKAN